MRLDILDEAVTDHYFKVLQKGVDGIKLSVHDSSNNQLYKGVVWPNE